MKAEEKKILKFLTWDENFIIPVYQRNYEWTEKQCKQLFDDLILINKNNYQTYFLWTIVVYKDDYWKDFLIIDWQQRLTTISILLLAIYNILNEWNIKSEEIEKEKILEFYLINKFQKDKNKQIKLQSVEKDKKAFFWIFEEEFINNSKITENYIFFKNKILENKINIDNLYKSIEKLVIVEIILKRWEDDPQLIFESLNSTWLDLSEWDKIRNFLLMKQKPEKQEELYKNYWFKIEENTKLNWSEVYKLSAFFRDYLTMKQRKIPNEKNIYFDFKEYFKKNSFEIEEILKDLLKNSKNYSKIINSNDDNKEISEILKRLNKLEILVSYPFLLELYNDYEKNYFTKKEFIEILLIIESFVFRRFICNLPTASLNKIFNILWKEIKSFIDYKENYFEIFKYVLLNKTWKWKFPKNEEFKNNFLIKDVYNTKKKNYYLLERLENFEQKESYVSSMIENKDLSIEHIMPQKLNENWKKDLWENYEEIHQKYLNTIWNLTLTWYNWKYSNKSFEEKKNIEKWFNKSPLYLNQYIKTCEKWTEKEIKERMNFLIEKSLKIWKYPKTDYEEQKDIFKFFTLADKYNFKWKKIDYFIFEDKKYSVNNWANFYEKIIKKLYNENSFLMKSFPNDEKLKSWFFDNKKNWDTCKKIDNNLYIEIWTNTERKIYFLKIIFDKLNIDLNKLKFYLK